ncbi:MAG: hypothetical protein WCJ09_14510 [Planctomycetota bacterium]
MSSVPPPNDTSDETSRAVPVSRSPWERMLIALVVVGTVGLIVVAIGQSIGLDLMSTARRWSRVRKLTPQAVAEPLVAASSGAASANPTRSTYSGSLAADAQISPPRRKSLASNNAASLDLPKDLDPDPSKDGAADPARGTELPVSLPVETSTATPDMNPRPPAAPVDSTEELLDAAAQLVSMSWQDFEYPVRWGVAETSKARMIYAGSRNRLLKAIAHTRPSDLSLELARKDYATACEQFREDPRLDYAFGLTLWKHGEFSEAIEMFQRAARLDEEPFLPAALAVAWGRFLSHEERRGLDQLAHIARLLAAAPDDYPKARQREQAATSIGRALGYLSGPGKIEELDETVQLTAINIMKRLPDDLREACERGREQVASRQSELLRLTTRPADQVHADHQLRQSELQTQIDVLKDEMRDASNELTRGHRTHIETVSQVLKEALDVGTQMRNLQSYIKQLQEKRTQLAKPKPNVVKRVLPEHYYIAGDNSSVQLIRQNGTVSFMLDERPTDRANRISQLTKVREDLKKIETELADLRSKQQDLVQRRRDTDQLRKLDKEEARQERVDRLNEQRELESRLRELNKALRRTMTLREGIDTIAAYIPWNVEVEGEALWQAMNRKPNRD